MIHWEKLVITVALKRVNRLFHKVRIALVFEKVKRAIRSIRSSRFLSKSNKSDSLINFKSNKSDLLLSLFL